MTGIDDTAALIKADRDLLKRIENSDLDTTSPTIIELKRIILRRLAGLQSELGAEVSSTEDELQADHNCLFLIE